MQAIKFDLTAIEDLKVQGLIDKLAELLDFMQLEVKKGNVIIIERRYSNVEPEIVLSIKNDLEFVEFKEAFL